MSNPNVLKTADQKQPRSRPATGLNAMFFPESIALVGATPNPETFSGRLLANLKLHRYKGEVFLVNPRHEKIGGERCFASIAELPSIPDTAMILTEGGRALELFKECNAAGVKAATIIGAGFGEAMAGGDDRVAELNSVLAEGNIRLCGPNTVGLANYYTGAVMLAAGNCPPSLVPGGLAVVSQSGGTGMTVLNKAHSRRLPTGLMVTTGNAVDCGVADYVRYFASCDRVTTIAVYFEAVEKLRELAEAFSEATSLGKMIVAYRAGRTEAGARMAASHTGVMTRASHTVDDMLGSTGAIMLGSLEEMFETAYASVMIGRLNGRGIAIAGVSGGCNVQAADKAIEHGFDIPALNEKTVKVLEENYPFATAQNPYDPTGLFRKDSSRLGAVVAALANDESVSATVYTLASNHAAYSSGMIDSVIDASRLTSNPLVAAYMSAGYLTRPFEDRFRENGVPVFESFDACFGAMSNLDKGRAHQPWVPHTAPDVSLTSDRSARFARIAASLSVGTQNEADSKRLVASYGINVVSESIVDTADAAVAVAKLYGYPVVMKKISPGLLHKSEVGGVLLGIGNDESVVRAFTALSGAESSQVLVQPQIQGGVELILGGRQDPQFGPIIMVGLGGIFTELLADVKCRLAPVSLADSDAMINSTKVVRLLDGFRGAAPGDKRAVHDMIVRLSWLLAEQSQVRELDLNPVIVSSSGAIAVDAAIVLAAS